MKLREEIISNPSAFMVRSPEGMHDITSAGISDKTDALVVGFQEKTGVMLQGLFFNDEGKAIGVPYTIIRREDDGETDRGSDDGVDRSGEGLDSAAEGEVVEAEGGAVDTAGDS